MKRGGDKGVRFNNKTSVKTIHEINEQMKTKKNNNNNNFNLTPRTALNPNNKNIMKNVRNAQGILQESSNSFKTKKPSFFNKIKQRRNSYVKNPFKIFNQRYLMEKMGRTKPLPRNGYHEVPHKSKTNQQNAYKRAENMRTNAKRNGGKTRKNKRRIKRVTKKRGRKKKEDTN